MLTNSLRRATSMATSLVSVRLHYKCTPEPIVRFRPSLALLVGARPHAARYPRRPSSLPVKKLPARNLMAIFVH